MSRPANAVPNRSHPEDIEAITREIMKRLGAGLRKIIKTRKNI